jgi:hypothetical protein
MQTVIPRAKIKCALGDHINGNKYAMEDFLSV